LREVFDEFKERMAQDVWTLVRGKEVVTLTRVFGPIDASRLVGDAQGRGLRVEVQRSDRVGYLPHNTTTRMALLIEDDNEAAEVAKRMIAAGVPVDLEEVD
jgi:hypothetical protein